MKPFSKKTLKASFPDDEYRYYDEAEERGSKEITMYDEEYEFLKKLIMVVGKAIPEAVPELKALAAQHPFQTIDDAGDLAAQVWTLATEKYGIPREWLMRQLPEKKASLKKADLKEYSNEETKGINDFIIQHPKVMEVVIDAAKRAIDEKSFTDWLQEALTGEGMEEGIRKAVKWEELGWAWFNTVNRETTEPTSTDVIEKLPTLDKPKKIDELLEQLSKEIDPTKQEQIKQHITRIKNAKLLRADLWPAQEASENMLSHEWNSLAYNPSQAADLSVSGPKPIDAKMDLAWSIISDKFFTSHDRWSSVVSELKSQIPSITDEDIKLLKDKVRQSLDAQMGSIASKKQNNKKIASDDLTQFALADKAIRQHFQNRGTTIEEVLSSLPNFSIKYIPKELEKQDPSLAEGTKGFYDYKNGVLYINPRLTLDSKRLTIIHEIEHAIQDASGVLPVHTEEDLNQVKRTPYVDRTFEWGARQQQFNALKARGMSLDEIKEFMLKRQVGNTKFDAYELNEVRQNISNEVEQMEDIYNEMMPESIMASKTAKKKSLNIDKVVQVLNQKEPKVIRVDPVKAVIELTDGSIVTFDDAVRRALDIDKTGVFQGSEFSNTDWTVNPTLDNGPFSSPEDVGKDEQKSPFPNTNWLPADDENKDEQPYSNVASSLKKAHCGPCAVIKAEVIKMLADLKYKDESVKADDLEELAKLSADPSNNSFIQYLSKVIEHLPEEHEKEIQKLKNHKLALEDIQKRIDEGNMVADKPLSKKDAMRKKANPDSRYWIAPNGKEYNAGTNHGAWINQNKELLKQQGINISTIGYTWDDLIKKGWVRVSNEPAGSGFQIQVQNLKNLPSFLDNFVSRNFSDGNVIEIGDQSGKIARVYDPFPSLQKAVNRYLSLNQTASASLKQADLSGQLVNEILKGIETSGGITYNATKGNLAGTDNYAVSVYPDREQIVDGPVDFDVLEGYVEANQDLLNDPNNSFGAWTNSGKVYLDVALTIPNKDEALELAKQHNQLAIWDLKNNKEISTGVVRAFSKKQLNKTAGEPILSQDQQNQVAAKWCPAMNVVLSSYADAVKRGHSKDRALKYALYSIQNIDKSITEKQAVEAIKIYLNGLV